MSQATVRFDLGAESVTVPLDIDLPTSVPLSGDVSGTFGDCFVAGDLNLTGNLFIEGLMTGIDTFHVQGNGFTIFFQNGGRADLHGKVKAAWGPWGTDATGWVTGDRLGVAPTATRFRVDGKMLGEFIPAESVWQGTWGTTLRPSISPARTLFNGTLVEPEVCNLSQSIVIENLARGFHFHDSAGVAFLSDVKFLNCGTEGVLGNYPVHFHLLGDNSRGSLLERVVVEGGKNHAFVPHGSHGITLRDCVAFKTHSHNFWWDDPVDHAPDDPNNSDDSDWDHCLAMGVDFNASLDSATWHGLAGFQLGAGSGNKIRNSVAAGVRGGSSAAGYHWPSKAAAESGGDNVWEFTDNVAHNCVTYGSRVWQNDNNPHVITNLTTYNVGVVGASHGAYLNRYVYENLVVETSPQQPTAFDLHAITGGNTNELTVRDVATNGVLRIKTHSQPSPNLIPVRFLRCTFTAVIYSEIAGTNLHPSHIIYEDCDRIVADFDLAGIHAGSIIEIVEAGVLTARWQSGVWN